MSSRLMLFLRLLPPDAFLPVGVRSVRLVRDENLRLLLLRLPGCSKLSLNFPLQKKNVMQLVLEPSRLVLTSSTQDEEMRIENMKISIEKFQNTNKYSV